MFHKDAPIPRVVTPAVIEISCLLVPNGIDTTEAVAAVAVQFKAGLMRVDLA